MINSLFKHEDNTNFKRIYLVRKSVYKKVHKKNNIWSSRGKEIDLKIFLCYLLLKNNIEELENLLRQRENGLLLVGYDGLD